MQDAFTAEVFEIEFCDILNEVEPFETKLLCIFTAELSVAVRDIYCSETF